MIYYRLEFTHAGLPKTTNLKRKFGHWAQYAKEASNLKAQLIPYLYTRRPDKPLPKAVLTLIRGSSTRPDFDGLVSSFKYVIDALVDAGIIKNDKHENIGQPNYDWEKAPPKGGYIRVIVEQPHE